MKKQNHQLRIVITQGKEVLAEVKMRRDTLEDLPNVPSLPGTIYNMIGDLCRLQAASAPRGKGLPPKKTLYHFTCKDCGGTFTVFGQYRDGDTVKCSSCGSTNEFKDSFASFDAYCDKCGGHVYGRTNSEGTEMVWTCRCRNDLILTWNKKLRKYTNGGK